MWIFTVVPHFAQGFLPPREIHCFRDVFLRKRPGTLDRQTKKTPFVKRPFPGKGAATLD